MTNNMMGNHTATPGGTPGRGFGQLQQPSSPFTPPQQHVPSGIGAGQPPIIGSAGGGGGGGMEGHGSGGVHSGQSDTTARAEDVAAWNAAVFQPGHIPETPPAAVYC